MAEACTARRWSCCATPRDVSRMSRGFLDVAAELRSPFLHPGGERATHVLLERLELAPGMRVLEIGCGTGSTTELVAAREYEIVAIDRSTVMLSAARERCANAGVVQ